MILILIPVPILILAHQVHDKVVLMGEGRDRREENRVPSRAGVRGWTGERGSKNCIARSLVKKIRILGS